MDISTPTIRHTHTCTQNNQKKEAGLYNTCNIDSKANQCLNKRKKSLELSRKHGRRLSVSRGVMRPTSPTPHKCRVGLPAPVRGGPRQAIPGAARRLDPPRGTAHIGRHTYMPTHANACHTDTHVKKQLTKLKSLVLHMKVSRDCRGKSQNGKAFTKLTPEGDGRQDG